MNHDLLTPAATSPPALPWRVQRWFNAGADFGLEALRGRVVAAHAFQMLCPGCVSHGLPQAQRIQALFDDSQVAVVGLHTVFEHHDAMTPVSLAAFLHEYRVTFPVGVDQPASSGPVPETMRAYGLRGTPSLLLIDAEGRLRAHAFGRPDDMAVGAAVATLVAERDSLRTKGPGEPVSGSAAEGCTDEACPVS